MREQKRLKAAGTPAREALTDRIRSLQAEEHQAQAELETVQLRVQLAAKSQECFPEQARGGFVSVAQVQQKQEELLDLQLRERNAHRNLQALQRDAQALRAEQASNDTLGQSTLVQLDRSLAALSQESTEAEARGGLTITAPRAGRIGALALHAGQSVQAARAQEPLYRITVGLQQQSMAAYGQARPLKAGMALDADVVQDRRAVWEWVLEPVLATAAGGPYPG